MESKLGVFPIKLPILVQTDLFVYPFMIVPLFLEDADSINAITKAMKEDEIIFVTTSIDEDVDDIKYMLGENDDLKYAKVGVVGRIMRKIALPNGRVKVLFQGIERGRVIEKLPNEKGAMMGKVDEFVYKDYDPTRVDALLHVLKEAIKDFAIKNSQFPADMLKTIEESEEPNRIVDLVASSINIKRQQAYDIFKSDDVEYRIYALTEHVLENTRFKELQKMITNKVHDKMEKVNKEYFLKEQLKQIQKELGIDTSRDDEIQRYTDQLEKIKNFISEDGYKEVKKQIDRLSKIRNDSGDANVLQNYIEWMLEIPFGKSANYKLSIDKVTKQLNNDHYSLEKPKERIIEYFAVRELIDKRQERSNKEAAKSSIKTSKINKIDKISKEQNKARGTILCFYGPPGVGKTSLANSIATAIKRPLVRIALGGLEDVNELRGHRRTYIGAMPGRIVQGLIEAKTMNPLVVLDEIDKVGTSYRGDPTSVLLEILDPEQNNAFRDYYANFNVDLSQCIFIATANDISTIPAPLRDRMEFISVSSYTPQEKFLIAKKYLIPQELQRHGLKKDEVTIEDSAIKEIIESYTREAGVRNLRRALANVMRKSAKLILENEDKKIKVNLSNLASFMDKIVFELNEITQENSVGVVNGLAWTSVGGDVLKIEAIRIKGKGALSLTGNLGEVMKESAHIAHSLVKVLIDEKILDIKPKKDGKKPQKIISSIYNAYDLHIHVPEGATPKDGPSAGIALVCVIASILSQKKIDSKIAMTGEITLRGDVLPIGGLKEKLIAAHKAGIKKAIIPLKNYERDIEDIPKVVVDEMEIIGVKKIEEVLDIALIR